MKDCISKNLQGDINEFLGSRVLTGVTGFNLHTKDHVTFQLKILFSENEKPQWEYGVYI